MNRETRRKLAKQMKISMKELNELLKPQIVDINIEDLPNGEKVRLKADKILERKEHLSEKFIKFVEENKDKIFTVTKYDNGVGEENSQRYTLNEDNSPEKWIFHIGDLELALDENELKNTIENINISV